jgi:uncharacterized protein involved in exopolysaccharide biosynthesis
MENSYQDDIVSIDFKALIKVLWKEKWINLLITAIFVLGGAWYAFTAQEEFVSEGKLLPEVSGGGGSSLGGLANLVGIGGFELGLKNSTDAIRPDLYPDVINSTPFFLGLLEQKFVTKGGDSLLFEKYYNDNIEKSKEPKEENLESFHIRADGIIQLSSLTEERIKALAQRVTAYIDKKSGIISISAKMPDPVVAAQIANYGMNYLTSYVSDYRTEKIKQEVDFLGRKVASARGEFYKDQARKASYSDQFSAPTIRFQAADIQRERLESEYKLSSSVYNELLKKFEESKIKLQQETPIFKVLNPPNVPNFKSEPKKAVILIFACFLGLFLGTFTSLIKSKNHKKFIH